MTSALLESATALASGGSLAEVLDVLCDEVLRGIRDCTVSVALWDPASHTLEVVASSGGNPVPIGWSFALDEFSPETRHALLSGQTVTVAAGSPSGLAGKRLGRDKSSASLGAPLMFGTAFMGILGVDDAVGRRVFLDRDVALAEGIASQAAVAIEGAQVKHAEREQVRLADELTRIEAGIHSSLDPERIIQGALEAGTRALGANTGAITVYEAPTFTCVYSVGFDPDIAGLVIPEEKENHSLIAIRTQEPVVVGDTEADERVDHEHLAAYGVAAVIVVPLVVGGEAVGNIYYNFSHSRAFSDAEIRFARRLSSSLSLAMENARLFAAERESRRAEAQRGERSSLLRDVADIGASSWDVAETAKRQLDVVAHALHARSAFLFVVSEDGRTLAPVATAGLPQDWVQQQFGPVEVDGEGTSAVVYRTGRPAFVADIESDPEISEAGRAFNRELGQRSGASLPLIVSGETMGAMSLAWVDPREFDEDETSFLTSLAAEVAVGLRNAQLFEAERAARRDASRELETTTLLLKAAGVMAESMDLEQVLRELIDIAIAATRRSRVTVSLFDPGRQELVVQAGTGDGALPAGERIPLDPPGAIGRSIAETRTVVTDFRVDGVSEQDRDAAALIGAEVALLVPLQADGEVIGHVWVDEPRDPRPFSDREIKVIEGLASHAAVAIQRARLYGQRTAQAQYAEALNRINAALHSSLDLDEILDRVGHELSRALEAEATAVHVRRSGRWALAYGHGLPSQMRRSLSEEAGSPVSDAVLETRQPLVVNGVLPDYEGNASILEHLAMSALIAAPLFVRGEVIGVLYAGRIGDGSAFDEYQIDFTRKVASTLSLALSNAAAYQSEKGIAHALQEAMLTLPRRVRGLEFAREYRAASETALVGGDFFDLFEIDEDLVGVTIGDVAGKGLGAAVTTSLVKNAIRARACGSACRPSEVLSVVNDVVYRDVPAEVFSTVFFGVLSRASGALRYANAGQVMAVLVSPDGTAEALHPTGPILGAYGGVPYEEREETLDAGALVLFTDGLTEARGGSEMFGELRLLELLGRKAGMDPELVVADVMEEVGRFTGGRLRDDVALLVLRRQFEAPQDTAAGSGPMP